MSVRPVKGFFGAPEPVLLPREDCVLMQALPAAEEGLPDFYTAPARALQAALLERMSFNPTLRNMASALNRALGENGSVLPAGNNMRATYQGITALAQTRLVGPTDQWLVLEGLHEMAHRLQAFPITLVGASFENTKGQIIYHEGGPRGLSTNAQPFWVAGSAVLDVCPIEAGSAKATLVAYTFQEADDAACYPKTCIQTDGGQIYVTEKPEEVRRRWASAVTTAALNRHCLPKLNSHAL